MLEITGKIQDIQKNNSQKDIYTVIVQKRVSLQRKDAKKYHNLLMPFTFWGKLSWMVKNREVKINQKVWIKFYISGRMKVYKGQVFWDITLVAEDCIDYDKMMQEKQAQNNQSFWNQKNFQQNNLPNDNFELNF